MMLSSKCMIREIILLPMFNILQMYKNYLLYQNIIKENYFSQNNTLFLKRSFPFLLYNVVKQKLLNCSLLDNLGNPSFIIL